MALLAGRRPDPPPLATDDVRTVAIGTWLWTLALAVLLVLRAADVTWVEDWWLLMCLAGAVLGGMGVAYCRRRRAAIVRDAARGGPAAG